MSSSSCFWTGTYSDENLPDGGNLQKADARHFIRRLRKLVAPKRIRFVIVGEYSEIWRPHYHAAIFNEDRVEKLREAWSRDGESLGRIDVSGLGVESAAYIVSYLLKRLNNAERCEGRSPEFKLQSLRPGIGLNAFKNLVLPKDTEVRGVRIANRIYPIGKYLRSQGTDIGEAATAAKEIQFKADLKSRDTIPELKQAFEERKENAKRKSIELKARQAGKSKI